MSVIYPLFNIRGTQVPRILLAGSYDTSFFLSYLIFGACVIHRYNRWSRARTERAQQVDVCDQKNILVDITVKLLINQRLI